MILGFVVNPIAGMGGSVGLKGTDGEEIVREAVARGAKETAPSRAVLAAVGWKGVRNLDIVTCEGIMGSQELTKAGVPFRIVFKPNERTSRQDTIGAVAAFKRERVDIIVFAGGDGTARDILDAVDAKVPVLGIPAGVKMHSAVFAQSPEDVGHVLMAFDETRATKDAEVMDIDEDSFRRGVLEARLYGYLSVPDDSAHIQQSKESYRSSSADEEAEELGKYLSETMEEGIAYILGPGSTTERVTKSLGLNKTLLGVDVIVNRSIVCKDATEKDILEILLKNSRRRILVTPIGGQGFIFGRGNQQISAEVIRAVGIENIVVIATPSKLRETPVIRVDTGDPQLDRAFRGSIKVVTGYKRRRLVPVL